MYVHTFLSVTTPTTTPTSGEVPFKLSYTVHGEIELLRSSVAPQLRGPPQKVDWGAPRPAPNRGVRVGRRSGWVRLHPDLAAMPPLLYLGVLGYCWSWRGGVGSGRERAEHVAQGTVRSPRQPLVEPEKETPSIIVRCGTQCCSGSNSTCVCSLWMHN